MVMGGGVTDRDTLSPSYTAWQEKYHYNSIENLIIEIFVKKNYREKIKVLDIGSGSGHWIEFYLNYIGIEKILGVELADHAADFLKKKFIENKLVHICCADISEYDLPFAERNFQIINAIGVIFHIVDDEKWRKFLSNVSELLADDGIAIIGGEFGEKTYAKQFHASDHFSSWDERQQQWKGLQETETRLINKKIRSLEDWKKAAQSVGLEVESLYFNKQVEGIKTPENNLLVLRKVNKADLGKV